jgi:hypothetical protein
LEEADDRAVVLQDDPLLLVAAPDVEAELLVEVA